MDEVAVFRASKRRKVNRAQQERSPEPAALGASTPPLRVEDKQDDTDKPQNEDDDRSEVDLSHLIRARKQLRRPVAGVSFSNARTTHNRPDDDGFDSAIVKADQSVDKPLDITNRFVSSTGQVIDVDQHMVAFIDAELARRRQRTVSPSSHTQQPTQKGDAVPNPSSSHSTADKPTTSSAIPPPSLPASVRQLSEVDLGSLAHDINLARTQAALQRAKAGQPPVAEEAPAPKPRKPRIGRDGKPMRPRPRKRRNSEDLARDALVEQVLHEHKFDIYDVNDPQLSRPSAGADAEAGDADERLAEQFRQEFMDAMAERHHRHKAPSQSKTSGAAATEPKGPKLGGGRSARQKMALLQQQQQQQQQGQPSGKK
ncbi:hypothetical protein A1O1_00596 [Capronia coronata CBS 617.96]|uniref:Uncharacterized protein n=1 Tax=Capronia coronata CBS 617.96 TaxID=1182541 RepID=W9ZLW0_9EURO|nr:uncharacterized protein A1O1_00596 [Capronia coronata CBS 617.96]EXJ95474.1 hypothetical protein A1O1_00596 [Capronia coronata CBS 617.96]